MAQETPEQPKKESPEPLVVTDSSTVTLKAIDPLRPAKAAFLSAILPGLGQAYNKRYWKVPLAIGGVVTGIVVVDYYTDRYNLYRDAYKRRLAGFEGDEFQGLLSDEGLQRAQKFHRRNKEMWTLITIGIYALNILDANVDAHLLQYNMDKNLSIKPHFEMNRMDGKANTGLSLNLRF